MSELARGIAENPPLVVKALKRGLRLALDPNWDELGSWVAFTLSQLFTTDDHRSCALPRSLVMSTRRAVTMTAVVLGQGVTTEVGEAAAPYRMDMVGIALGVVVLGQDVGVL